MCLRQRSKARVETRRETESESECETEIETKCENRSRVYTSNGFCRREEKSCKHWSLLTKLLFSVTENLSIC